MTKRSAAAASLIAVAALLGAAIPVAHGDGGWRLGDAKGDAAPLPDRRADLLQASLEPAAEWDAGRRVVIRVAGFDPGFVGRVATYAVAGLGADGSELVLTARLVDGRVASVERRTVSADGTVLDALCRGDSCASVDAGAARISFPFPDGVRVVRVEAAVLGEAAVGEAGAAAPVAWDRLPDVGDAS
jgi:hypothetical protein